MLGRGEGEWQTRRFDCEPSRRFSGAGAITVGGGTVRHPIPANHPSNMGFRRRQSQPPPLDFMADNRRSHRSLRWRVGTLLLWVVTFAIAMSLERLLVDWPWRVWLWVAIGAGVASVPLVMSPESRSEWRHAHAKTVEDYRGMIPDRAGVLWMAYCMAGCWIVGLMVWGLLRVGFWLLGI